MSCPKCSSYMSQIVALKEEREKTAEKVARLKKQTEADSDAMNQLAAAISEKDRERLEMCRKCTRGMK